MKIRLGDNIYDVNLGDNESIKDVLEHEIRFQYAKYNIPLSDENSLILNIRNRKLSNGYIVKSISFFPSGVYYEYNTTIQCFSKSIEKSMNDLIVKVISKCQNHSRIKHEKNNYNQEFKDEISKLFPHVNIEFSNDIYISNVTAKIKFDGYKIMIDNNDSGWITYLCLDDDQSIEDIKQNTIKIINKLLK
jgi:hypothetical protein